LSRGSEISSFFYFVHFCFIQAVENGTLNQTKVLPPAPVDTTTTTQLVKRIVVALDVRSNDHGDLVVTKGDQYDVRESSKDNENGDNDDSNNNARGGVRNLGKPVELASRYYQEGADEIAFLNITSFRQGVIEDMPMLQVLEQASKHIFVPLTVGGGIRSYEDAVTGQSWSALEVAARYFRAGADKVSIGSDAVYAAEQYVASSGVATGQSSIEQISRVYGVQAVVVSIDPKRVYVVENMVCTNANHVNVELDADQAGPNGETKCWFQCTVKGGRESRDICAVTLAKAVQALGAGEIMLNCIDMDGQGNGFDLALMRAVSNAVSIPIIASSGAGKQEHFSQVFSKTNVQAALAAGMFHRKEVEIEDVKKHMRELGIPARKRL
jgi:imidazole glycerol-phosphate synthase